MYNLHLSAEQIEFRDTVRGFVEETKWKPVTLERCIALTPATVRLPDGRARAKPRRWDCAPSRCRRSLGGVGADALTCCIVTEELAAGDTDVAAVLAETSMHGRLLFSAKTPQNSANASCPPSSRTTTTIWRWPAASRATTVRSASTTTGPPRACALPPPQSATATTGSSTAPRIASPTRRSPS